MREKSNNKCIVLLIIILIVIILGLVGFIVYDKILYKENINDKTTSTTKNNKEEDSVLRRDNFIYELNDKDYNISYVYKVMESEEFYNGKTIDKDNLKEYKNYVYNMVYLEILLNEEEIVMEKIPLYYDYENIEKENLLSYVNLLSSDNIYTLNGSDKEYFVFAIEHKHPYVDGSVNPFVVNEKGKVLHKIKFKENTSWWITDENSIMYEKGEYYLTTDTFYYSMPNCDKSGGNKLYFNQYSLKIENNEVVIKELGTYQGLAAGGTVCQN